jgi:hypothetical protein
MGYRLGDAVWDRSGRESNELSKRLYIAAVSGFTVYGLAVTSLIAFMTLEWQPASFLEVLIIGLVIPIAGIYIALTSDKAPISLFGYTLVVVGIGILMGPTVHRYKIDVIMRALIATGGVTIVMSVIGIIYPKSLEHWGGYLFSALSALLLVRITQMFLIGFHVIPAKFWYIPIVEYAAALLFTLYIIYDWNRALRIPRTMDNAVDCALAIYLDIVNLFLELLRILGKSKD